MLFIILNYLLPVSLLTAAILFAVSIKKEQKRTNHQLEESKRELYEHSSETKCKYKQLERDVVEIKEQIADIPKHKELADLTQDFRSMNERVELMLKEVPERIKQHNLKNAMDISNQLKEAFQVLLQSELESHGLKLTKK